MSQRDETLQTRPTPEEYALIFEHHKTGAKIFEDLILRFGRVPHAEADGINRVLNQFEYAGARKVLEFITLKINQANGLDHESTIEID